MTDADRTRPDAGARLAEIHDRIDAAAARAGRDAAGVRVVAATKTRSVEQIAELIAAGDARTGVAALGENRVQEAIPKIDALGTELEWHFIGVLQTNKVKYLADRFTMVHSVDRPQLVDALARRAPNIRVLVQVNVAGEASKAGAAPDDAATLCRRVRDAGLALDGLMTMPPQGDPGATRAAFADLRRLRDAVRDDVGAGLPELSMGMSEDFEIAVEEGATILRLGRVLFGPRE